MNTTSPRVGEGALPLLGRECPAAPVDQGTRSTAGSGTHRTASTAGGGQPPRGSSAPTPPDSTWPRLRLAAIAIMVGERSRPTRRPPPSPSHTRDAATPCPHPTSRTSSASSIPSRFTAHSTRCEGLGGMPAASPVAGERCAGRASAPAAPARARRLGRLEEENHHQDDDDDQGSDAYVHVAPPFGIGVYPIRQAPRPSPPAAVRDRLSSSIRKPAWERLPRPYGCHP